MKCNQYLVKDHAGKMARLLLILLFPVFTHAQQEYHDDSTAVYPADTDFEKVEDEPMYDDRRNDYFLPRWTEGQPDSVTTRLLNHSVIDSMQKDEDFWYANATFKKEKQKTEPATKTSNWEGLLWIIIIIGFIGFLVIYLTNSNVALFRKSKAIHLEEEELVTDDIFAINYQKEIDKATKAGNYRLAVRLHFLRLLKNLSDRHYIRYKHDSTNFDYLLQLNQQPWYQYFFRITRNYEYVWYGQFDVDREKFEILKKDFTNLEEKL